MELTDRELTIVSCLAKHIREQAENYRYDIKGWDELLKELGELITLADNGLATSLINKLYRSSSF